MDLLDSLLTTELFEGLSRRDLEALGPSLRRRTFPKGVFLWHAGDPVVGLGGVHVGCWQVFGTGAVTSILDLRGKTIVTGGPAAGLSAFGPAVPAPLADTFVVAYRA